MSGPPKSFSLASQGLNVLDLLTQTRLLLALWLFRTSSNKFASGGWKAKAYLFYSLCRQYICMFILYANAVLYSNIQAAKMHRIARLVRNVEASVSYGKKSAKLNFVYEEKIAAEGPASLLVFLGGFREKHTALQSRIAPSEVASCGNALLYRARLDQCSGSGDAEKVFRAPVVRSTVSLDNFKKGLMNNGWRK